VWCATLPMPQGLVRGVADRDVLGKRLPGKRQGNRAKKGLKIEST